MNHAPSLTTLARQRPLVPPPITAEPVNDDGDDGASDLRPGRRTRIAAPASCGELGVGEIDGQPFLVNCPVELFARATVRDVPEDGIQIDGPAPLTRVAAALQQMADRIDEVTRARVTIYSPIPRGKGMGSSQADICAALMALSQHRGIALSSAVLGRLVATIEPANGIHATGIAEVQPMTGQVNGIWSAPRGMRVLVVDCGEHLATASVDAPRSQALYAESRQQVLHFRALLRYGLTMGDPEAIGRGATLSTELRQRIHPKPQFDELLRVTTSRGAWGINCAREGTLLGVLHDDSRLLTESLISAIGATFGHDVAILGNYRIINGGCQHPH